MRTIKTLTTQPETRGRGRGCRVSSQCRGRCVPPPGAHRPPAAAAHWTPSPRPHTLSSWRPATGMGGRLHYGEHAGMRREEGSISSRAAITPKRHTPSKKKVKKQVYCGTPGCTDEWNGNAPRRVRIIMIRIKNRAVERLHHDAFFCFFFSFSSFSFSISATYFSISSGFNILRGWSRLMIASSMFLPPD